MVNVLVCVFGLSLVCMGVHTCMYACIVNIFDLCFKFWLTCCIRISKHTEASSKNLSTMANKFLSTLS
jgi:hypothetical protein